ncbi:MAG: DUF2935 domain-containing protein [Bacilli bacterium]
MNNNEYIRLSLELHLFFDRIMKEHSLFLSSSFTEKDNELKKIANNFQKTFSNILERIITLSDGNISADLLNSNEIVTKYTKDAENKTRNLTKIDINTNITEKEEKLRSGEVIVNEQLMNNISLINRQTLPVIQKLIEFKTDILNKILSCKMYTTNYPLLITHIKNEAKMYYNLLTRIEEKAPFTNNYIYEQEIFWNNIMMEHALFIRGLLDPSENELVLTADSYAKKYQSILKNYIKNPIDLTIASLKETINFREFKIAGEEGILSCKIKSVIIPLLADHVVREANHFIRILKNESKKTNYLS